jgi:glyoxylase-like metal-dependent hydrolase (beta-lactamase superfamily II)
MSAEPVSLRRLPGLEEAWRERVPGRRLELLRSAAAEAREALLEAGPVEGLATCPLVTFPYPTVFAFSGAALSPAPYVMMTNRMQVVQYRDWDGRSRILLFNPTDYDRGERTPFFARLMERYGDFISRRVMRTRHGTVASHLEALGLRPEDVDYLAFDHLHVQDLRGWLGGEGASAFFPRARLLVHRMEWAGANDLHPMQRAWFVPDGMKGVPAERVVQVEGDAWLGPGVAIVATPGHTMGNWSLAVVTGRGLFVVSENGVATESYSPERSGIPGIRATAEHMGYEVVLNGNSREHSLDQYSSMVVEKVLAGPSKVEAGYVNFFPSSELTASLMAPALSPTFSHREISQGQIVPPRAHIRAA